MTTTVGRQEPRKSRIISAVSPAAMAPSLSTAATDMATKTDWSNRDLMTIPAGAASRATTKVRLIASTRSSVETLPFLMAAISTEGMPSARTIFCCTMLPSRTWPMSRRKTVAPSA